MNDTRVLTQFSEAVIKYDPSAKNAKLSTKDRVVSRAFLHCYQNEDRSFNKLLVQLLAQILNYPGIALTGGREKRNSYARRLKTTKGTNGKGRNKTHGLYSRHTQSREAPSKDIHGSAMPIARLTEYDFLGTCPEDTIIVATPASYLKKENPVTAHDKSLIVRLKIGKGRLVNFKTKTEKYEFQDEPTNENKPKLSRNVKDSMSYIITAGELSNKQEREASEEECWDGEDQSWDEEEEDDESWDEEEKNYSEKKKINSSRHRKLKRSAQYSLEMEVDG